MDGSLAFQAQGANRERYPSLVPGLARPLPPRLPPFFLPFCFRFFFPARATTAPVAAGQSSALPRRLATFGRNVLGAAVERWVCVLRY